jgi:hypothetical protein
VSRHDSGGAGFDTEPVIRPEEVVETYEYLSMACLGVAVGVNQIIEGTPGGNALNQLAEMHTGLSNRSASGKAPARPGQ